MKNFEEIKKWLAEADAVIVTAGNGFEIGRAHV